MLLPFTAEPSFQGQNRKRCWQMVHPSVPRDLALELNLARAVQERFLPREPKYLATIRFAAASIPAREIGGDYYDFLDLGPQLLGFTVADVCGKGIAAALLAANLQASVRSECARGVCDLVTMLEHINMRFFQATLPEQYATIFFGQYDDLTRRVRFINCGQPALLMRANESAGWLQGTAMPLGVAAEWKGEVQTVELMPDDTLCICSDGVLEAGIDTGEEFGERRLASALRACRFWDVETTVECIVDEIRKYRPDQAEDDMTVVGIRGI
jgi:sigma-B regulation protein RsbU (phosphoserine phosphatase)